MTTRREAIHFSIMKLKKKNMTPLFLSELIAKVGSPYLEDGALVMAKFSKREITREDALSRLWSIMKKIHRSSGPT